MTVDDIVGLFFLLASLAIIVDFGRSGWYLMQLSRGVAAGRLRPFIRGMAWLLLSMAGLNVFWLVVVILGDAIEVAGPVLYGVMGIFGLLVFAAIRKRRQWWRDILGPVMGDMEGE